MNAKKIEEALVPTCNAMKAMFRGQIATDEMIETIIARSSSSILSSIINGNAQTRVSRPFNH